MALLRPRTEDERMRIGATRLGMQFDVYRRHIEGGLKWCSLHQRWHRISAFGADRTRADGRAKHCKQAHAERRAKIRRSA